MPTTASRRERRSLYIRMTLGAGLLGIALGYYLQMTGRLEMTPFLVFAFAVRGIIVGALIWAFEFFVMIGPDGNRFKGLSASARFAVRIIGYLILGELGYWIGEAIFDPDEIADLFHTANGPK